MTTSVYLVRHAAHALVDRTLVGRSAHVGLSAHGWSEALGLGERLAREPIACVQSSPQRRARETARAIANAIGLPVDIAPQMDELDMGEWTGLSFDELERDPRWRQWNSRRGSARPPGGESMRELQSRVLDHLTTLRHNDPDGEIVIVSHAEPIRAAVLHYRGLSLDDFVKVQIAPGSITMLVLNRQGGQIAEQHEALQDLVTS